MGKENYQSAKKFASELFEDPKATSLQIIDIIGEQFPMLSWEEITNIIFENCRQRAKNRAKIK